MFGTKSFAYDDENQLTSLTSGGVTDLYYYNALGQRYRARLNGTYWRYVYNGDRVLEETNDSGTVLARYTTASPSYFSPLLHMWRSSSTSRFPLYDLTGSARGLVDANGAVTDSYELDAFGRMVSSSGSTMNPYKYNAAWGYISDPSGFLQLGHRYYYPELGRFLQQDPIRSGMNQYLYARDNPVTLIDPNGREETTSMWANLWQPETLDQLGMSAGATLTGIVDGASLGIVPGLKALGVLPPGFADWTDPCDPFAGFSRGGGAVSGGALAAAAGAAALGVEANVFSKGNVVKVISKRLRRGFRLDIGKHGPWGHPHWWRW